MPRIALTHLLTVCALLALPTVAFAQPTPPQPPPQQQPQLSAADYVAQSTAALERGDPNLAGQLLLLSYRDLGDAQALYYAGLIFYHAGLRPQARAAWQHYLCVSPSPEGRRDVRLHLLGMQPHWAPPPCRVGDAPLVVATPAPGPQPASELNWELATGLRAGSGTFGSLWEPGLWVGRPYDMQVGLFVPIFVGARPGPDRSIGLEPRLRLGLRDGLSAEVGAGIHAGDGADAARYSIAGGLNFNDVITLRVTRDYFQDYDGGSEYFSATFVDAVFTGKTGKTITAAEAGIALLIMALQ